MTLKNITKEQLKKKSVSQYNEGKVVVDFLYKIKEKTKLNKWCVDVGAGHGKSGSNVWHLIKYDMWKAIILDKNPICFKLLEKEYEGLEDRVLCEKIEIIHEGKNSLDNILVSTSIPVDFDLLSIDINGDDYHVWNALEKYSPKIVIIEFNPTMAANLEFVQPLGAFMGNSLLSLVKLGKKKGYELAAVTMCNGFFVKKELFPCLDIENNSIYTLFKEGLVTKAFQAYDGKMFFSNFRPVWAGPSTKLLDDKIVNIIDEKELIEKLNL